MLRSRCLVFVMLMELCKRNLFLLDKLWINNFICRCWKDYAIVYGKNDQQCGAAVIGSFITTMPLPTRPCVCSSFWQKTKWRLSLILPTHPTLRHATFSCSLIKRQMKGKRFADVTEVKKKTLEVLNNISTKEFQKCFQHWEKRWYKCIESKEEYFEGD